MQAAAQTPSPKPAAAAPAADEPAATRTAQLLVLGAGPGGYTAAFRAADLGLKVTLVERWSTLGGVCLNVGCIPSKALLHAARVIEEVHEMSTRGIVFGPPQVDLVKLREWRGSVVRKLTGGLAALAKQRKVEVVRGEAKFLSPHVIEVTAAGKSETIRFDQCIIAAGSESVRLPFLPQDPRIIDSTGALELPDNPGEFLVIGGGIIGLEMACVFDALGARVSVVELSPQLMPGCDPDPCAAVGKAHSRALRPGSAQHARYRLSRDRGRWPAGDAGSAGWGKNTTQRYDHVLVAVGRSPNGGRIGGRPRRGAGGQERLHR